MRRIALLWKCDPTACPSHKVHLNGSSETEMPLKTSASGLRFGKMDPKSRFQIIKERKVSLLRGGMMFAERNTTSIQRYCTHHTPSPLSQSLDWSLATRRNPRRLGSSLIHPSQPNAVCPNRTLFPIPHSPWSSRTCMILVEQRCCSLFQPICTNFSLSTAVQISLHKHLFGVVWILPNEWSKHWGMNRLWNLDF